MTSDRVVSTDAAARMKVYVVVLGHEGDEIGPAYTTSELAETVARRRSREHDAMMLDFQRRGYSHADFLKEVEWTRDHPHPWSVVECEVDPAESP